VPSRCRRRPSLDRVGPAGDDRGVTRRTGPGAPLLLAALVLSACSAGPRADDAEAPPSSDAPALSAPELEGGEAGDGSADGGAPSFEGRKALTVSAARRTAVTEPCTANQIERLCGSSAVFEVEPVGPETPVTLVSATTRPDRAGLTWFVRLRFAPGGAPLPTRETRGDGLVLTDRAGRQVPVTRDARVTERSIVLPGFPKRGAWLLVEQLAGEA